MEDRVTPVIYLEMTDRPAERYAEERGTPGPRTARSSPGELVGKLRSIPH